MRNQDTNSGIIKSVISTSIAFCMILSTTLPTLADSIPTSYPPISNSVSQLNQTSNIIPDQNLKAIINSELDRPQDTDITKKDIKKLKLLDASYSNISNTSCLEYATNDFP